MDQRIEAGPLFAALVLVIAGGLPAHASGAQTSFPRFATPVRAIELRHPASPVELVAADMNGDGLDDVIAPKGRFQSGETFPLEILLNDRRGGLLAGPAAVFAGPAPQTMEPRRLIIADFNGDRRADVFIGDQGKDLPPYAGFQNTLALSAPAGKLVDATANLPQEVNYTHGAAAGDVDADGDIDLYEGNFSPAPRLLLNDGQGRFAVSPGALPPEVVSLGGGYASACLVDATGDRALDLVLGGITNDFFSIDSVILVNDGHGRFTPGPTLPRPPFGFVTATDIQSADVNRDSQPDLIVSYVKQVPFHLGRWLQVLVNHGNGSFRDETASRLAQGDNTSAWIKTTTLRDLDADGAVDIATQLVTGGPREDPPAYLNDGDGLFRPLPPGLGIGTDNLYAFADIDGDGGRDVVINQRTSPQTEQYLIVREIGGRLSTLYGTIKPSRVSLTAGSRSPRVTRVAAGRYRIVVDDRSRRSGFRLVGPGVAKKTGTSFTGRVTWTVRLSRGKYRYSSSTSGSLRAAVTVR